MHFALVGRPALEAIFHNADIVVVPLVALLVVWIGAGRYKRPA
jgi:hypothetical protein